MIGTFGSFAVGAFHAVAAQTLRETPPLLVSRNLESLAGIPVRPARPPARATALTLARLAKRLVMLVLG
jgi:hypothetical protein